MVDRLIDRRLNLERKTLNLASHTFKLHRLQRVYVLILLKLLFLLVNDLLFQKARIVLLWVNRLRLETHLAHPLLLLRASLLEVFNRLHSFIRSVTAHYSVSIILVIMRFNLNELLSSHTLLFLSCLSQVSRGIEVLADSTAIRSCTRLEHAW